MSEITIENLCEKDIQETRSLFYSILDNTFTLTFPEEAIRKYKSSWQIETFETSVNNEKTVMLIAKKNNKIVGLLVGSPLNGGVASIAWVAVSSEARGMGVGQMLCDRAESAYRMIGAHKIVLYTETESAKRFYERIGYSLEGTHPNHWWGVDHYCMAKIL